MSKITEQDRTLMVKHLREISKLSMKANIKHHTVIEKHISHTIDLAKFMKEDRGQIQRLNNVIDIKQREIDELNSKQMELLWDLAKLEKKVAALEKEKELDEKQADKIKKRLAKQFNLESTDN
jgi:chromosome segregation ATPase